MLPRPSLAQWVGIVAVTIFIAVEVLVAAAAAIWGLGGLLHLPMAGQSVLALLIGAPAIAVIIRVGFLAYRAETDPVNN